MPVSERKVATASAATLLMATRKAKRDLSDAADDVLDDIPEAVKYGKTKRSTVQQSIMNTAKLLVPALTGALVLSGRMIGDKARDRLAAELKAVGLDLKLEPLATLSAFETQEAVMAQAAAESLAASWRNQALSRTTTALRQEKPLSKAFAESRKAIEPSIERTAITEATRAYNEAHAAELKAMMDRSAEARRFVEQNDIVREWVALIDACDDCRDLDGTQVGLDEEFPGGEEPPLHPRCRCHISITTAASSGLRVA